MTLVTGIAQPRLGEGLPAVARRLENDTLCMLARDGRALPALAERWSVDEDGRSWRIQLREGLVFHDGSSLDSSAVAAGLQPDQLGPDTFGLTPGLRDIVSVTTEGPRVVRIDLRAPSSLLLEALALLPVVTGNDGEIGAGPFITVSRDPERILMRGFDRYYLGRPAIDQIDLRTFATPRVAWSAMLRGEIDFLYEVAPESVEFIEATSDVQPLTAPRPYVYLVGFNLAHPVLRRTDVRLALNQAVSRSGLIRGLLGGRGEAAASHVWPRHWALAGGVSAVTDDPARARVAIEAALPVIDARTGTHLRFTCLVPADYPIFERLAIFVQRSLLDIGVDMALEPVPQLELRKRLASGDFDAYLFEMLGGFGLNWTYWFWHGHQNTQARYVKSGYDAIDRQLDDVRTARTSESEHRAVRALDAAMRADPPALFLAWSETARAVRRTFTLPTDPRRDAAGTVAQWRPAPATE